MNVFLDNNLPPRFSAGLHGFSNGNLPINSVIHLSERFKRDTPDHVWMDQLAKEGGWMIVTQDGMKKNDLERRALRQKGLFVVVLQKQWANFGYWQKAQNLIKWWPDIVNHVSKMEGGCAIRVCWRHTGKFEQI